MKRLSLIILFAAFAMISVALDGIMVSPVQKEKNVNPDTHLSITFKEKPELTNRGTIRIYSKKDGTLVDKLDLSIPAGPVQSVDHGKNTPPYSPEPYKYTSENLTNANSKPGTPSGLASANADSFQLNIIGRFTDAFHFYPVIVHGNTAKIYPHNNLLNYNREYYVQIDADIFSFKSPETFKGINDKSWSFSTKKNPPSINKYNLIVDASGKGDFNTVQGAVDFIPDFSEKIYTVFIKKGNYEEIIYFRNKSNILFIGESRDSTRVFYANNEVFNPHPSNISTNEWPGTFPSRRAAFACDNSSNIRFENFTIATTAKGQAEGLLIMGQRNILKNMHIIGSGDAIQINGSAYLENCTIDGDGDTYLGRGPAYFKDCRINSFGTFFWVRNTNTNHGVVLNNCELVCSGNNNETDIARAPDNRGKGYPYCEAVLLNCFLSGINDIGWGDPGKNTANVHYWEYNSCDLKTKRPVDVSKRHPVSRQLTLEKDAEIIHNYLSPEWVLDGWNPNLPLKQK
jgi:pectin methylesterase-like acyl-CoA thioesterase